MNPTHLALVGLMGVGKTSVGRLLADQLGLPLVDVDDHIEKRTGHSVRELWEAGGEPAFRPLERDVVLAALERDQPCVLAAPGGVVLDDACGHALRQPHVAVAYLRADPVVVARRVADDDQERPLLGADPAQVLSHHHGLRDSAYSALAELIVDVDELDAEEVAARVLSAGLVERPTARSSS